ncbi:MAG: HAMP domain-containing histidine kinase [Pseudomonadota bacterium]|nr:HAMP domain-containing histidine kinase [Pseudomonadota bacterium]
MYASFLERRKENSLLSRYSEDLGSCVSRARSERALRAAAMDQALASRAKSEFLANMSHELRTPLNAIIGFSELIRYLGGNAEKACEYSGLIEQAGRHLLEIISDILDISKIESGHFELDLEQASVPDLVGACVSLVEARIVGKNQVLQLRLAPELPEIRADVTRLKQVIINLLSNAHKFTPEGGRIVLAATASANNTVTIAIQDTGIGMSGEQIAVALTPFGQIRSGHTRAHEGTGLGLPIAKALIEQHRGRFYINSVENGGTTIAFTLPHDPGRIAESPAKEGAQ